MPDHRARFDEQILRDFNRRFSETSRKRNASWEEDILPLFRYLTMRIRTCKCGCLDDYEFLVMESSGRLRKHHRLRDKIDSASKEMLELVKKRRDECEKKAQEALKKAEETKTKVTLRGFEREKKTERFAPEESENRDS